MATKVNERGNTIERSSNLGGNRYEYDFGECSRANGWVQYDTSQDAWYFGVWVHPEKREILTYAEGDVDRVICATEKNYHAELKYMSEFYGDPPRAFVVISLEEKTITEIFTERPA